MAGMIYPKNPHLGEKAGPNFCADFRQLLILRHPVLSVSPSFQRRDKDL
jgi:hypothetical protein